MNISFPFASRLLAGCGLAALLGAGLIASSRPAHTAGGPIPVAIDNLPLATVGMDNPALQPFQGTTFFRTLVSRNAKTGVSSHTLVAFTVPNGKRLVIQGVSVTGFAYLAGEHPSVLLSTTAGGTTATQTLGYFEPGDGTMFDLPFKPVTVYADPGTTVTLTLLGAGEDLPVITKGLKDVPAGSTGPEGSVTGYLVDVP